MADKKGNRFELSWAILHALRCIQDERRSITLEDLDENLAEGSEFTYVDEHGTTSVTQVKRQNSIADHWTIAALRSRGIFAAATHHVMAGRSYHFTSMTPSASLRELGERARESADLQHFTAHHLNQRLRLVFDELCAPDVLGSPDQAWQVLRGMWFEVEDEQQQVKTNAMLAATMLEGAAESLLPLAVGAVLLDNLRHRLTRRELLDGLSRHGVVARHATAKRTAHDEVHAATLSWRNTVERELLSPPIPRTEALDLVNLTRTTRVVLVVGTGGGGKSSVVYQAANDLESSGAEVLAFRLDRRGAFSSTSELGAQLGLSASPIAALRMAADGREAFVIIDQLDAVSLASGRLSERYDVIADLIHEAMAVEGVSVILACRTFDVENDHRIRKLDAREDVKRLTVSPLPDAAVLNAVGEMGLDAKRLTPRQLELLRSPLNLVLLETVATQPGALNFTSRGSLFEAFWQRKRQTIKSYRPNVRFNEVLARVANAASDQQSLSVKVEILDPDDYIDDAYVLASEQVLAIDGDRVSFFHESFFDYTFARQWLLRGESMIEFLQNQEQELFRRAQVRQILELLHEGSPSRFRTEIETVLLAPTIRFHIKETVLSVLANIAEPTGEDLALVLRISDTESALTRRFWQQITRPNWFDVFHKHGYIEKWLDSEDPVLSEMGADWLSNAGDERGAVVAGVLARRCAAPDYPKWLTRASQRAQLHRNRPMFDLILEAVRANQIDPVNDHLGLSTHDLAKHEPLWAIELLRACLVESPSAWATDPDGKISLLETHSYGFTEMIAGASKAEPQAFAETLVPYLLAVMERTSYERHENNLISDRHFSFRLISRPRSDDVGEELYYRAARALARWSSTEPKTAEPLLRTLAQDDHDAAQALLFRALIHSAEHFADWAAQLILEGGNRLSSGYTSDSHWLSRELIEAIAPLVSDEIHERLENSLRDYRNHYERGMSFGYTAFKFLTALDVERLGSLGRRRLAEYRRKFGVEAPASPTGIVGYTVGSPIEAAATEKMSNEQWLRALTKHNSNHRNSEDYSVGGARELAQMLKNRTAEDPVRFATLAMQFSATTHAAYPSAILWGLGEATITSEAQQPVFDAIRYIGGLELEECDRWLGWSLRHLLDDAPLDLVELVTNRAIRSKNPENDTFPAAGQRDGRAGRDLRQHGFNTARGSLAEHLGDLLIHDPDGRRTAAVSPYLVALASDRVLSVRSCVAHTIAASLRHARPEAYDAFERLINADDMLLASDLVGDLMIYIGNVDPDRIFPVIERMLSSDNAEVRHAGGSMAAFAALQWERAELIDQAIAGDIDTRTGAALVCSARVARAANSDLVFSALRRLMNDADDDVRKAVGRLAANLRGQVLSPFARLLADLIASPSYVHATPQLFITLQEAPDEVDELIDLAAQRFIEIHGNDVGDVRTDAAGDSHYISELVVRGLAQAHDGARVSTLLGVLDHLLELGAYGVDESIEKAERL